MGVGLASVPFLFLFSTNYPTPACSSALSCGGAASDVFGIHRDNVVYDDGAHGEGTESVGEGVQSVVGYHYGERILGEARDCKQRRNRVSFVIAPSDRALVTDPQSCTAIVRDRQVTG